MTIHRLGPNTDASARARTMNGKASTASMNRARIASIDAAEVSGDQAERDAGDGAR